MSSTPTGRSAGSRRPPSRRGRAAAATAGASGELLVGIIAKPHGLGGELSVDVHTDSPEERFATGSVLVLRRLGVPDGSVTVESARPHSGRMLVRFAEAADRTAAEELRGGRLLVRAAALPPPADPEAFHVHQLEGLRAELADGGLVGTVREVVLGPGGDLLAVAREGRPDALVPFVREIVPTVDLETGRIVLTPPEGLLDLD